jgi:hypothetical protein
MGAAGRDIEESSATGQCQGLPRGGQSRLYVLYRQHYNDPDPYRVKCSVAGPSLTPVRHSLRELFALSQPQKGFGPVCRVR